MHGRWVSRDRHGDDILERGELYSLDVLVRVKSIMRIYILALNAILTIRRLYLAGEQRTAYK